MSRVYVLSMAKTNRELQHEVLVKEGIIQELAAQQNHMRETSEALSKRVEELQAKVVELSKRNEGQDKTTRNLIERRNALRNHIRLAVTTCTRGRRQKGKRVRALRYAQAMLESALEEDDYLAPPWEWLPIASLLGSFLTMGVLGYAATAWGKKA